MPDIIHLSQLPQRANGFFAEMPYTTPEPGDLRRPHEIRDFIVVEGDSKSAERLLQEQVLSRSGLVKCGIFAVDKFLLPRISELKDGEGMPLDSAQLSPGDILEINLTDEEYKKIVDSSR